MIRPDKGEITWTTSFPLSIGTLQPQDKALVIDVLSERAEGCKVRLQWRIITHPYSDP